MRTLRSHRWTKTAGRSFARSNLRGAVVRACMRLSEQGEPTMERPN